MSALDLDCKPFERRLITVCLRKDGAVSLMMVPCAGTCISDKLLDQRSLNMKAHFLLFSRYEYLVK